MIIQLVVDETTVQEKDHKSTEKLLIAEALIENEEVSSKGVHYADITDERDEAWPLVLLRDGAACKLKVVDECDENS